MRRLLAVCVVMAASATAGAQGPDAQWRTITTTHFRIHYPQEYEAWTARAASRLESIHDVVAREIGYDPPDIIDVIVSNPIARPNGLAWPFLDNPRIVLYTEPPGPDEHIGAYSNWIDLLAVHEVAHVIHMLRPSRNGLQRLVERYFLPLNRISLGAPRWVLEGYATVIEGRLTGAGRPSSTARALILRQWAANGRLPSYDQLDSDSRFLGMSIAYLAGSAYLEWLEQRTGEGSLRKVWTRMTATRKRSFDEAFAGVFGESPERLYGQFSAELTASALAANQAAPMREGELWQETSRRSGDPDVSPDGAQIVLVERFLNKPSRLVIWSTAAPEKEEERYQEQLAKIRERDPDDILPVRSKPLRRNAVHTFTPPDGGDIETPRWMPGGSSILYSHRQPDSDGFLHHDLFLWTPDSGENRRVTRLADVSDAGPLPDGRTAVALRTRHGFSQIVIVDLQSGEVRPLTDPSIDIVYSHPRAHEDGRRIAWVANRAGVWSITIRDLETGAESVIAPAAGDAFASPEWRQNDLIATMYSRGYAELVRLSLSGESVPITRTAGGALQPAPAPDGRIFFMSLEPDGFVVRVIDDADAAPPPPLDDALVPAVPPRPTAATAFAAADLPPSHPYGVGRQEISWLTGFNLAPSQNALEAGIRVGDVVGRLDTIVAASFGADDAQRGAAVATAWRGWPITIGAHLFRSEDRRGDRDGVEVRATWDRRTPQSLLALESGALTGSLDLAFIAGGFNAFVRSSSVRLDYGASFDYDDGDFRQAGWGLHAGASAGASRLALRFERRILSGGDGRHALELGGLPSTIIPDAAFANRILDPAIPVASLAGDRYEGRRVEARLPAFPLTLFYQQHLLDSIGVEVMGGELAIRS
ncbi:MAG TPA: hypothetical protein VFT12_02085, partial [Thermoanaerobaculia bacterium]|nr:hypothetical protein [Thermoanaerobaculia bacterium]